MATELSFSEIFRALTGFAPMPWQEALYERFVSDDEKNIPASCNLPTGLGKTSVIAIWLIALANRPGKMPRRLVYVVNRRTVVDQTTDEAIKLKDRLRRPEEPVQFPVDIAARKYLAAKLGDLCKGQSLDPLAISTLRGQYADNREWSADPSRPAVICGTVDMIGSRLLFSGYGVGFKAKPLHAGFLGQDALLVHDEAHLEPAFQKLIKQIEDEQQRESARLGNRPWPNLRVMELTATSRNGGLAEAKEKTHGLTVEELNPPETLPNPPTKPIHYVWQRLRAKKGLKFVPSNRADTAKVIGQLARTKRSSGQAVLIFVRTIEDVKTVRTELTKDNKKAAPDDRKGIDSRHIQVLTGTLRGLERDQMADPREDSGCPVFARFLANAKPDAPEREKWKVEPNQGTVFLICTSAGEVGVDLSADCMVCDLTTLESMAQRLGRANRLGDGAAEIDVVYESDPDPKKQKDPLEKARWKTKEILGRLPQCDWINDDRREASPLELRRLKMSDEERDGAFAPEPTMLEATDILFDAWSLTSIKGTMPGRPPVEPYLHGIAEWQPPETHVAWRQEVEIIVGDLLDRYPPAEVLDVYPIKPHELLRDHSDRVFKHLEALSQRHADKPVWLVDNRGDVQITTLDQLADKNRKNRINGCIVLLPPSAGGLAGGMLDNESLQADDVADISLPHHDARARIWRGDLADVRKIEDMRRVKTIEVDTGDDDEPRRWEWFERFPEEGGRTAKKPVLWKTHVDDVVARLKQILAALSLPAEMNNAVILASELHDHGKKRERFQVTLGNRGYPGVLWAKSGKTGARLPEPFRHEFASLFDAHADARFRALSEEMKELALHLIATHHGRARPHFSPDEAFDPDWPSSDAEAMAIETPRRFARLQRRYGRWGLAYLESLLRAADWAASGAPSAEVDEPEADR